MNVLGDLEEILSTNKAFLLGTWLNDAKRAATNDNVRNFFVNFSKVT